jgi:UDP:flavonoid glycosyltransferase YjiC (YdhE family)
MKLLLIPENNSLSHIAKCLSIMAILQTNGHEVHLACSEQHHAFLTHLGIRHHILADIQETDCGGFPSYKWFSNIEIITACIQAEVALIQKIKPDRILGVFRFTLYASAQIANVPYDSLICGCMIPDSQEVLGFSPSEPGTELQKQYLANFFRFAGKKFSGATARFGLAPLEDIRYALKGERTFLWDFPEFMPLPQHTDAVHIGPITFRHWPCNPVNLEQILGSRRPIAVISFGTCVTEPAVVSRMTQLLLGLDYQVIIAAGGQPELANLSIADPRVNVFQFAPLEQIFPHTALLVTHGGQMTVFEALQNQVPVLVMPLQPEQAHNGVCLERIGCGARLIPSTYFTGMPEDFITAFKQRSDREITTVITDLVNNRRTQINLAKIQAALGHYRGAAALAHFYEVN